MARRTPQIFQRRLNFTFLHRFPLGWYTMQRSRWNLYIGPIKHGKVSVRTSVKPRLHDTTGCQTRCQTGWQLVVSCIQTKWLYRVYSRFSNRLYNPVWQPVERTVAVRSTRLQPVWQLVLKRDNPFDNRLTTGWMSVYTIQPVIKPVVQPVSQPVVSCKRGLREPVNSSHDQLLTP